MQSLQAANHFEKLRSQVATLRINIFHSFVNF